MNLTKKRISLFCTFLLGISAYAQTIKVCPSCEVKTIQQAVERAKDHDTILIEKGTYKVNDLVIKKPLTFIGKNKPIIDAENKGEIFIISASNVHIKGIHFKNVGHSFMKDLAALRFDRSEDFSVIDNTMENVYYGIILHKGKRGVIKNNYVKGIQRQEFDSGNAIHLWDCRAITITNNVVTNARDGIYLQFTSGSVIQHNDSHNNLRYGLHFMFSNDNEYHKNTFSANGAGVAVMFSKRIKMTQNTFQKNWGTASYGLLLKEIYDAEIQNNTFYQNTIGINGESCTRINYKENIFSENGWGIRIKGACFDNHFWDNDFLNNTFDVSYNNKMNANTFKNNYWSDYTGYDLNKDGIGDVPYRPVKLFSYIANKTPESIILLRSLFIDIVNFSEKVAPAFTPENLIDENPRMRPFHSQKK
ncbi:MAG: nitrous oxide reductase family maturation protein NosD [Capnocytophaga sp.]|nr:nitrous oxide reductase family maturation protein NosD [Capnocytophaga sp.]